MLTLVASGPAPNAPIGAKIWLIAAALVAIPALGGHLLGRAGRRRGQGVGVGVVTTPAVCAAMVLQAGWLPAWDVLWAAGVAAAAAATSLLRPTRAQVAVLGASVVLCAAGVEVGWRLAVTARHGASPLTWTSRETAYSLERYCDLVDGSHDAATPPDVVVQRRRQAHPGRPVVVHLGDSMLDRSGDTFIHALNGRGGPETSMNFGLFGTSVDFALRVYRAWIGPTRPALVVYYPFAGNDLGDLQRGTLCFGAGPVSCPRDGVLHEMPPDPTRRVPLKIRLTIGPAPLVVRTLGRWSVAARAADGSLRRMASRLPSPTTSCRDASGRPADDSSALEHYRVAAEAFAGAVARDGIELWVVVLPFRDEIEGAAAGGEPRGADTSAAIAQVWQDAGVRTIDAWDWFAAAHRGGVRDLWLGQTEGRRDFHLGPGGDRILTERLAPLLDARFEGDAGR